MVREQKKKFGSVPYRPAPIIACPKNGIMHDGIIDAVIPHTRRNDRRLRIMLPEEIAAAIADYPVAEPEPVPYLNEWVSLAVIYRHKESFPRTKITDALQKYARHVPTRKEGKKISVYVTEENAHLFFRHVAEQRPETTFTLDDILAGVDLPTDFVQGSISLLGEEMFGRDCTCGYSDCRVRLLIILYKRQCEAERNANH